MTAASASLSGQARTAGKRRDVAGGDTDDWDGNVTFF